MTGIALTLHNLNETEVLARRVASLCGCGETITLRGTLGTGKTAFARAFIRHFTPDAEEVVSPTFSLLQVYPCHPERSEGSPAAGDPSPTAQDDNYGEIWHLDLYRLKSAEEALEIGIEDGWERAILLIEWPEVIEHLLPANRLDITMEYGAKPDERVVNLQPHGTWINKLSS